MTVGQQLGAEGVPSSVRVTGTRERPPDELALCVANEPSFPLADYTLSSEWPGGFTTADAAAFDVAEGSRALHRFASASLKAPDRTLAWEGRIDSTPKRTEERQLRVALIGHRALLTDIAHVVFLGVCNDLAEWGDPPRSRREYVEGTTASLNAAFDRSIEDGGITIAMDPDRVVKNHAIGEVWFRAPISQLVAEVQYILSQSQSANMDPVLGSTADPGGALDETTSPTFDSLVHSWTPSEARRYVVLRDSPTTDVTKEARAVHLHAASLYGDHGLPRHAIDGAADGLLFSDILDYLVGVYVPQLATSIAPSVFAMPSAYWPEPVTLASVLEDGLAFEPDRGWAVWEGPTLHWGDRRSQGAVWNLRRSEGARFVDSGETSEPAHNGVIVTYTDKYDIPRWAGPPGSGADVEDAALADSDPDNPATLAGLTRYLAISVDTAREERAVEVGELALREALKVRFSGEVEAPRYAERDGQISPTWMMRAGDRVKDADVAGSEEMLLVDATYTRSGERPLSASIEQPSNRLDAAVARMGATIHRRNRQISRHERRLKRRLARRRRLGHVRH